MYILVWILKHLLARLLLVASYIPKRLRLQFPLDYLSPTEPTENMSRNDLQYYMKDSLPGLVPRGQPQDDHLEFIPSR